MERISLKNQTYTHETRTAGKPNDFEETHAVKLSSEEYTA